MTSKTGTRNGGTGPRCGVSGACRRRGTPARKCGAAVATPDPILREHLGQFGHAFGMAFQARDDYLGIWGRSEQTGKPVGADITRGKRSLPIVHALQQAAT